MTEWPLTNPLSTNVTSSLHNHERWKTSMPDSKFRTSCHKPLNWKTCIQSPPKIFQSVVQNVECRDRLEGMDTASFGNLQKSPEYLRHCSKVVEIFLETRIKCIQKSLSFDSRKESSFQLCYSPFPLKNVWVGHFLGEKPWGRGWILLEKKFDRRLFLGLLLGSSRSTIGQSFSLSLVTIPELFAKVNSAEFPCSFVSPV